MNQYHVPIQNLTGAKPEEVTPGQQSFTLSLELVPIMHVADVGW